MDVNEILTLDSLPIPSIELYTFLSFLAAYISLYYCSINSPVPSLILINNTLNSSSNDDLVHLKEEKINSFKNSFFMMMITMSPASDSECSFKNTTQCYLENSIVPSNLMYYWTSHHPLLIWPIVNLAYCILILCSHYVQKIVFGPLRASEQENIKDQFWNLIFYKIVFIFGVVNVQDIGDCIGWCFFVTIIGILQLARQLCKERHNYLIVMNDWSEESRMRRRRILFLLSFIFSSTIFFIFSILSSYYIILNYTHYLNPSDEDNTNSSNIIGWNNGIFMLSELLLLLIQTTQVLTICIVDQIRFKHRRAAQKYIYEGYVSSNFNGPLPPRDDVGGWISHSINFYFDLVTLLFDLLNHMHMLVCCNLFLSMTSLIISLQMRSRARQIHSILKKRQAYTWLSRHISQYPDFSPDATSDDAENCAICWESISLGSPKSLPCSHIFHSGCLKKWLLVSMNCPTCRLTLISPSSPPTKSQHSSNSHNSHNGHSGHRVHYDPSPDGLWGFLQTGQTLLDLFGGWDPQVEEIGTHEPSIIDSDPVSLFRDVMDENWANGEVIN